MRNGTAKLRVLLATALAALPAAGLHAADPYPARTITMVVSAAPGGAVDVTARTIQPRMAQVLGQAIVVDNRPGAGGHIGNAMVAKAPPHGYTILATSGSVLGSGVYRNLPYNPATDLAPIGMYATAGFLLLVPASSPFHTVGDLITFAKANPGKLNYGSTGMGNSTHIAGEMLNGMAGLKTTHVPYKGSMAALTDLMGARIDFLFDNKASAMPQIKAGTIRALAVTSPRRYPDLPNLPAVAETLPAFQMEGWIGMFAPKGTDKAIVDKLSAALKTSLSEPAIATKVADLVGEASYMPPQELTTYMQEDRERLQKVVRSANIFVE